MNDSSEQILGAEGDKLASLMESGHGGIWRSEELEAVFRHQMTAPVEFDLAGFDPVFARRLRMLAGAQGLLVRNFRDLFQHPCPPAALLEAVKDFAKRAAASREEILPKDIARMLYYLAITAALARAGRRITSLKDVEILRGLRWALKQAWLDDESRALLEEGIKRIQDSREDEI